MNQHFFKNVFLLSVTLIIFSIFTYIFKSKKCLTCYMFDIVNVCQNSYCILFQIGMC